eukprot:3769280-Alexandrium_andersonii.AAC.1
MSASLVGSEMCIRDRFGPLRPHPPLDERIGMSMRRGADIQKWFVHGAVSYTHLTLPTICSV